MDRSIDQSIDRRPFHSRFELPWFILFQFLSFVRTSHSSGMVSPAARMSSNMRAGLATSTAPPRAVEPSQPKRNFSALLVGSRISAASDDDDDDELVDGRCQRAGAKAVVEPIRVATVASPIFMMAWTVGTVRSNAADERESNVLKSRRRREPAR